MDSPTTHNNYEGKTTAELIALLNAKDQQLEKQAPVRKTKRVSSKPKATHLDHYCLASSTEITDKESYQSNKALLKSVFSKEERQFIINTMKNYPVSVVVCKTFTEGLYIQENYILIDLPEGVDLPTCKGASSTTFTLEVKGADYPRQIVDFASKILAPIQGLSQNSDSFYDLVYEKIQQGGKYYFPKDPEVATHIIKKEYTKSHLQELGLSMLLDLKPFGQEEFEKMRFDAICLNDKDLLKKQISRYFQKKPKVSEGRPDLHTDKDGVLTDMSIKENREKHLKIACDNARRCSCLLDLKSKGRCIKEGKWCLPNGMRVCSAHAGQVLQTKYLLGFGRDEVPEDYTHGPRAGFCKNECRMFDCSCEPNVSQQDFCKKAFKLLTNEEKAHYNSLRSKKTNYDEIFHAYLF